MDRELRLSGNHEVVEGDGVRECWRGVFLQGLTGEMISGIRTIAYTVLL